jgi:hypothetical protein
MVIGKSGIMASVLKRVVLLLLWQPVGPYHIVYRHCELPDKSGSIQHTNLEQCAQWGWIATSRRVGIRNDEVGLQTEKKHDFDGDFDE